MIVGPDKLIYKILIPEPKGINQSEYSDADGGNIIMNVKETMCEVVNLIWLSVGTSGALL